MNIDLTQLTTTPIEDPEGEPVYDSPNGCVAIVAVGADGDYVMIEKPNLQMFDVEKKPQYNGFGDDYDYGDFAPGVYRITYSFTTHRDWESGHVDDWEFAPEKVERLWPPLPLWKRIRNAILTKQTT